MLSETGNIWKCYPGLVKWQPDPTGRQLTLSSFPPLPAVRSGRDIPDTQAGTQHNPLSGPILVTAFPAAASAQGWACREQCLWPTTPAKAVKPGEAPWPSLSPPQLQLLGHFPQSQLTESPPSAFRSLRRPRPVGQRPSTSAWHSGHFTTGLRPCHFLHVPRTPVTLGLSLFPERARPVHCSAPCRNGSLHSLPSFTLCARECVVGSKALPQLDVRSLGVSVHLPEPQFARL